MKKGMVGDDSMSNITCASNEASISSSNRAEIGSALYRPQQSLNLQTQSAATKRKRNQPGNPDPDAEVIALSPRSLLATNRFVCEICNKGFQRDQNLQLHRRGHNLPWKLKTRNSTEVIKKKVYVCPEASCVHSHPSRALGDLTGIKKHFCRKHGEKKWKCDKCSKRYAVQSDWKAHSKICGTREYRCDCGTLFSRRDSFITHRAFCDALAEESSRTIIQAAPSPLLASTSHHLNLQAIQNFQLKQEPTHFNPSTHLSSQLFIHEQNPNFGASAHMSATALLQKAAEMGVTMSNGTTATTSLLNRPHHMSAAGHALASYGDNNNKGSFDATGFMPSTLSCTSLGFVDGATTLKGAVNEALTRDFLGLRAFPHHHTDFPNTTAALHHMPSSSYDQNQFPWKN